MADITEILEARAVSYEQSGPSAHHTAALLREAKSEIEQLRAEVELWKDRHDAAVEAAQQMEHHFDEMWRQERG